MLKMNPDGSVRTYRGETEKAYERRVREGWFDEYAPTDQPGLDIGAKDDPLNFTFRRWDLTFGDGDATDLEGVPDNTYQTVYASHVLEHLKYHRKAIRRWFEVLKPGGHLIICVPHRDLYEKKKMLPSNWNHEHVRFWLPNLEEPPCTLNLNKEINLAIPQADIVSFRVLNEGYAEQIDEGIANELGIEVSDHPVGEYAIEAIIRK